MNPGIVLFTLIITIGGLVFYYLRIKHWETMARIDHGLEPAPKDPYWLTKLAILMIALAVGFVLGYLTGVRLHIPYLVTVPSSILLVGGLALLGINRMIR